LICKSEKFVYFPVPAAVSVIQFPRFESARTEISVYKISY